jgi:two-component system cell cycle response regulator DivK
MGVYWYQEFEAAVMETETEIKIDPKKKLNPGELRVLIVEDEEANIAVIQQILELMLGIEHVFAARDGHEGIRMAYELEPNLILMDLSLPKLNGWEVTRSLKSNPRFKEIPILALTAHAMVGDREKALDAGCDDYFAKPIEVDEFVKFLSPYLASATELRT